jgi:hypothetical protein
MVSLLVSILFVGNISQVLASEGEIGFFGGISEGDYLPKTIEKYVPDTTIKTQTYDYKEMVFITGTPIEVTGTIAITIDTVNMTKNPTGSYKEKYVIEASNTESGLSLSRNVQLRTSYYLKEGEFKKQVVKNSSLTSWDEEITTEDTTFTSDSASFSKATVEDMTAGVNYYSTTLSYAITFYDEDENSLLMTVAGEIYGYSQPWSKVETQKLNMGLSSDSLDINMDIKLNPRLEAKKTIYYNENEPFPISFGGTYNQRMEREATLEYEILSYHPDLTSSQLKS